MYICLDCGAVFDEPQHWEEKHGLTHGPYEEFSGCPECGGAYAETFKCSCCDEWIDGDYIETADDGRYCEACYCKKTIG